MSRKPQQPKATQWARQNAWRFSFMGQHGPRATVRLVLHSLHARMNLHGVAWPSVSTIAKDSGLTERTASKALAEAVNEQWLERQLQSAKGSAWARYRYQSKFPPTALAAMLEKQGAALPARGGEGNSGTGKRRQKGAKEFPTN